MKKLIIVANWKENKTESEAATWLNEISKINLSTTNKKIIVCPPFTVLAAVSDYVKSNNLPLEIGVQTVSAFDEGPHTGEISAKEAAEFSSFAIIGHSERRALGETDEDVEEKVKRAKIVNVEPIVCVVNENVPVPQGSKIVAYEPVEAIGTGKPDTPENAEKIASFIKSKNSQIESVLYGGSVTSSNVQEFVTAENIDGVLVGGASLDPVEFGKIINKC